ncbi:PPK2 family polyphosphate kinase [Algiphilus sp.]|uniref:PPK2 family polyphosphate kinase n=1 Tax=Algiphilus sp. TaxID=1872431 RepID=UPI0032F03133
MDTEAARVEVAPYRVDDGETFALERFPTAVTANYRDRGDYRKRMDAYRRAIRLWQRKLFAEGRHALLVVVQGMDAAGKNGLIRRVLGSVDPTGLHVWSFGPPTSKELRQDFMRRYHQYLPEYGSIAAFNRSYYEFALSARIHPEWLAARGIDAAQAKNGRFWEQTYGTIQAFEGYLQDNGIHVVKLMPHVSQQAQGQRLLDRLHKEDKRWKLTEADCEDAGRWDELAAAYDACIHGTATTKAPWFVLPGDDKRTARLLAAEAVLQKLEQLSPQWPDGLDGNNAAKRARIAAILNGGKT